MKQIIKNFNNLVKKTIFNVQNKTNNNFNISLFNKYLITFIASLFIYLFYLLIPLLYDKNWIQTNIEKKLLSEFKVNISISSDIAYRILPAPHFLIKDSKILLDDGRKIKSIAEIKDLKVFLSQKNFFDKEKMNIKKLVINDANFSLQRNNLKLIPELTNKKFPNKKININNSNIFFKDNIKEIVSIIKINKTVLFFDDEKKSNSLDLKGEAFNIPFTFNFNKYHDAINHVIIKFWSKPLRLKILNESTIEKGLVSGKNNISFLKSKINTKYTSKEKLIYFVSNNSRLNSSELNYSGKLSINPFDLDLKVYFDNYKISKLFNINSILIEFIKSGLLFNENISVNTSIIINSNKRNEIFHNAKINFHIMNGKIHFDKTKFINNDIGSIQLNNSNLFYKNNDLVFNGNLLVDIKNSENLFSFLKTNKSSRKDFKTVLINLDYNFLNNNIKFNTIKIDNSDVNSQFLSIIDSLNGEELNNFSITRKLLNKLFKSYAG